MELLSVLLTLVGTFIVCRAVASIAIFLVRGVARKRKEIVTESALHAADFPISIISLLIAAYVTMKFHSIPIEAFGYSVSREIVFSVLSIIIAAFGIDRVLGYALEAYETRVERKVELRFLQRMVSIIIWVCATLMILALFKIDIAPILAGLGIVGLAFALALQEPLKNFFAALNILSERQFKTGDYIIIDANPNLAGTITDIKWRTTKITTFKGTTIIIPNAKLAESTIEVAARPLAKTRETIKVVVAYGAPLTKVETILNHTIRSFVEKGVDKSFKPVVGISNFAEAGVEYSISYLHEAGTDAMVVASEIRKAIIREFKKENIEIPYPTYSINIKEM